MSRLWKDGVMPKLIRGAGAVGLGLTLWDVWRRLPKKQRKEITKLVRRHGPTVAKQAVRAARARKRG
jgi:hypothetical protein